nr:MAG TPA: helix-turn-helix domain protein [Bacteriophage sp.]
MTTGELIRQARMSAGLTQKELGNRAGIAEPTIGRYELGKLNPKPATLKKIAAALGVEWYELLSDDSEEQVEVVKSYIGEKIAKSGIQNDAERTFLIRETINNYYNQLNIDGKLAAYKILFERSEDAVLADSIQDFKALADTPQYQKKAEE